MTISSFSLYVIKCIIALWDRYIIYRHFTGEETEDRRGWDLAQEHKARKWQSQAQMLTLCPMASAQTPAMVPFYSSTTYFPICTQLTPTIFQNSFGVTFPGNFLDVPLWWHLSDLALPWARTTPTTALSHYAIQSWAARGHQPFHIQLCSSTAQWEHLCIAGIRSTGLVCWWNKWMRKENWG